MGTRNSNLKSQNYNSKLKNSKDITITVLGSHSALDVCRGAKDLGFKTLVITAKGRDKVYSNFYKASGSIGCVDECLILNEFKDILDKKFQEKIIERNAIFVPHRSFEVYINDYNAIEKKFIVPMFGNRFLLKIEERGVKPNQYDLMAKAGIRFPKIFENPKDIDRLCIVKVLEKERGFERAFFLVSSYAEFWNEAEKRIDDGLFTKKQLDEAVIEEFLVGVQVNFNFFHSPINNRLELLGTDARRQTNIEGFSRIPGIQQTELLNHLNLKYEEAGHIAVTVLESMLEQVFELGEKFVKATQQLAAPGVIGPFGLQSMILPGPPKKEIVVFDISPRMPGSPGIFSTPYTGYLFGENISVGKRVAIEINEAMKTNNLNSILT